MHAFNFTNVDELDMMASEIQVPEIYGVFENHKHYLSTLKLLLASTTETQNRNDFFIRNILPYVTRKSMLDIGVGDGKLTELVGRNFQEVTVVDPSEYALASAKFRLKNENVLIRKIKSSILDVSLPKESFDLVILSHTLYYIDVNLWMSITEKLLSSLKKNGLLVIVMNGGGDKDVIAKKFGGRILEIDDFIENCKKLKVKTVDVNYSTEYFTTRNLLAMFHILGLHLYDVGAVATAHQLTEFLKTKENPSTMLYEFLVYQKFILIRK